MYGRYIYRYNTYIYMMLWYLIIMCIISKPDYTAIHIIECAHNIYVYSNIYRRYACTSVLGIPITYYTHTHTHTHPTRTVGKRIINIYYIFYVLRVSCVCVCVYKMMPPMDVMKLNPGRVCSLQWNAARRGALSSRSVSPRVSWILCTAASIGRRRSGFKSAAAVSTTAAVSAAISIAQFSILFSHHLHGSRSRRLPIRAVDWTRIIKSVSNVPARIHGIVGRYV